MVCSIWWMQDWSLVTSAFRTVFRMQKSPFSWCEGSKDYVQGCAGEEWSSALLCGAAEWCQQLLLPQGLVWGWHRLLKREALEWAMSWMDCKWGTGLCLFSPPLAGMEAEKVTDTPEVLCIRGLLLLIVKNCSKLCYVVTSQGPGLVSIPLPCPEFC